MKRTQRLLAAAAFLGLAFLAAGLARAATLTNSTGATVEALSAEADSGATLTNTLGATVVVAGTDQASVDTSDSAGAWLLAGLLDPPDPTTSAARNWALYE